MASAMTACQSALPYPGSLHAVGLGGHLQKSVKAPTFVCQPAVADAGADPYGVCDACRSGGQGQSRRPRHRLVLLHVREEHPDERPPDKQDSAKRSCESDEQACRISIGVTDDPSQLTTPCPHQKQRQQKRQRRRDLDHLQPIQQQVRFERSSCRDRPRNTRVTPRRT